MKGLSAFTWGYFGWGNTSTHFLRAVDALESRRGFQPPLFIDLRISRSVRAQNFQGDRFSVTVGDERYRWLPRLGNLRILSGQGERIQIADPTAIDELLDAVVEAHTGRRRIIMFCSCSLPLLDGGDGHPTCHRVTVAGLLLGAARRRRMPLELSEWPGEGPSLEQCVPATVQRRALSKRMKYIPVASLAEPPRLPVTLGWGSIVRFADADDAWTIVTGPARVKKGEWALEVLGDGPLLGARAASDATRLSHELLVSGYGPRR